MHTLASGARGPDLGKISPLFQIQKETRKITRYNFTPTFFIIGAAAIFAACPRWKEEETEEDLLAEPKRIIFWEIGWKVAVVVIADIFFSVVVYNILTTTFRDFCRVVSLPNLPPLDFIHFCVVRICQTNKQTNKQQ